MKTILSLLAAAMVISAEEPKVIKLKDTEKLKIRNAQVQVFASQENLRQLESLYRNEQERLKINRAAFDKIMTEIRTTYKCEKCEFNDDLDLKKPENGKK